MGHYFCYCDGWAVADAAFCGEAGVSVSLAGGCGCVTLTPDFQG